MLVRISAMWCSSCIIMKSRLNDILKNYDIELIDYDYDLDTDKINDYNVGEILPVLIKIEDGKEIKRLVGEHNKEELIKFIEG